MNRLYAVVFALACLPGFTPAVADVHKCTDAQGKVTYRDTACGDSSPALKRQAKPAAAPAAPAADDRMEKTQRLLRAYEAERQEKKEEQANARAEKERRARNCVLAKDRLRRFETAGRIYKLNKEGERVYHSDAARAQSMERAKADVAEWCG